MPQVNIDSILKNLNNQYKDSEIENQNTVEIIDDDQSEELKFSENNTYKLASSSMRQKRFQQTLNPLDTRKRKSAHSNTMKLMNNSTSALLQ